MKILLIASTYLPRIGGAEIAVHNLAEGLTELGHNVFLNHWMKKNGEEYECNYRVLRYKRFRGSGRLGLSEWCYKQWISWVVKIWRPDIVHVNFLWPGGVWATEVLKGSNIPLVLTAQGEDIQRYHDIPYGYRLKPVLKEKIDRAIQSADCLIAIGDDVRNEYLEIGVDPDLIFNIPNSINFYKLFSSSSNARNYLNIPDDVPVILAVGRNHPKKGFPTLINSIKIVTIQRKKIKK